MTTTAVTLIVGAVLLTALLVFAAVVAMRARSMAHQQPVMPNDELADFQRMREEGSITEEEYRRLKRVVADQTVDKVKDQMDP